VGQGALGIMIRQGGAAVAGLVGILDHPDTRVATTAERVFLCQLEGGCQVPIGALGVIDEDRVALHGFVASLDGRQFLRGVVSGPRADAGDIGRTLAADLRSEGASDILSEVRRVAGGDPPPASAP
jgi:hydroxymethylbilane synthase